MAKLGKLEKINAIKTFPNVFEFPTDMKGRWAEHFGNDNDIVLELGCGRGEYTVALARNFPEVNFIGVDIKGPRIWKGAHIALEEGLKNAAFCRFLIENLTEYFAPGEAAGMWIPFPDPYPKPSKEQKRLISQRFRSLYRQILRPGGIINFKTDNTGLFEWGLPDLEADPGVEVLESTADLDRSEYLNELTSISTYYESLFRAEGKTIKYIRFRLR